MKQFLLAMGIISAFVLMGAGGFWLLNTDLTTPASPVLTPTSVSPLPLRPPISTRKLPPVAANAAIRRRIARAEAVRPRVVTQWDGASENIVFSRDGRCIAQSTPSAVEIRRTKDWKSSLLFGGSNTFAMSGDFGLLATTNGYKINVWRLRDRKLVHSLDGANAIYWPLSFSPDNRQLAAIGLPEWLTSREGPTDGYPQPVPKELKVWKLGGAKTPTVQAGPVTHLDEGLGIAWTKTKVGQAVAWKAFSFAGYGDAKPVAGHTLWVRVDSDFIEARDATTGELLSRIPRPSKMGPIAVTPDATLFAAADAADPLVYIWRLTDGKLLATIKKPGARKALALAFSSDGRQLAVSFLVLPAPLNNSYAGRKGATVIYALDRSISRRR